MTNLDLLLATFSFQRVDRQGRVRTQMLDELRRRAQGARVPRCCPPPCCVCCWEAL